LVHLDLMVSSMLDLKPPRDPMDSKQVKEFIKSIDSTLGIDDRPLLYEDRSLSQYYEQDCCDEEGNPDTPLSRLPENYLEAAIEGFKVNFRPWVIKLLLEFKPYRNLLEYAREHNLIEGVFGQYQAQTSKHKGIIKQQETTKDADWHSREILSHQTAIANMKENQWVFKSIFQKAIVRLGRMIEFDYKGKDSNLGNIDNVIAFLDGIYEHGVLKIDAELPNHPFRLWTFIALNPGNEKIKVAKTVEDKIFYLLSLWYFGTRKLKIDNAKEIPISSKRKLLQFFSADVNTTSWPKCVDAYKTLYKGFDTNALYGKDHDRLSDDSKKDIVRARFADVLVAGIAEYQNQAQDAKIVEEDEL
jgi:hypothetical protein